MKDLYLYLPLPKPKEVEVGVIIVRREGHKKNGENWCRPLVLSTKLIICPCSAIQTLGNNFLICNIMWLHPYSTNFAGKENAKTMGWWRLDQGSRDVSDDRQDVRNDWLPWKETFTAQYVKVKLKLPWELPQVVHSKAVEYLPRKVVGIVTLVQVRDTVCIRAIRARIHITVKL